MLTAEYVRQRLDYCQESGVFRWKTLVPHCRYQVGDVAGSMGSHYWRIHLHKRQYRAHRLAWLHVHGEWPAETIDHINGDKMDNRIANLREVSMQINNQNLRKAACDSKTGVLGVGSDRPGRYRTAIVVDGKRIFLGRFKTVEEAHAVYVDAKRRLHDGCTI